LRALNLGTGTGGRTMNKETVKFIIRIVLSLVVGFLVVYPLWLYGRHFLIR
jgi:hypothetical protein